MITTPTEIEKATWTQSYVNSLPDSSFLHVESGEQDEAGRTIPRSLRHFPYRGAGGDVDLPHLRNALSRLGQTETGTRAGERWLTAALRERLAARARRILEEQQKSVLDKVKEWFGLGRKKRGNSFTVWKEGEDWRWLAVYSNKFRDRDDPPEILAEASHKEFMGAVDAGEWRHPELQLWHVPGSKVGRADMLAYDNRGFSIAAGTGEPEIMETLSKQKDSGVSHGMPKSEIEYDNDDSSVIVRYRSSEISVLPRKAAANELTGFVVLEDDMALSEEKQAYLTEILGEERLDSIMEHIEGLAKEAKDQGLEYKETEDPEGDPAAEEEPQEDPPDYVTRDEVAEAVGQALSGFQEQIDSLAQASEATAEVLKSISESVSGLERSDEEKIKDLNEDTPAASLTEMIASAIGREETRIDGRTRLAKDAPKEELGAKTGIPIVDALIGDGDWKKALEA